MDKIRIAQRKILPASIFRRALFSHSVIIVRDSSPISVYLGASLVASLLMDEDSDFLWGLVLLALNLMLRSSFDGICRRYVSSFLSPPLLSISLNTFSLPSKALGQDS